MSQATIKPAPPETYTHGTFTWAELYTSDVAGARDFYSALLGWSYSEDEIPGGGTYTMAHLGQYDICGLYNPGADGPPPMFGSYLTVDDIDAVCAKAVSLGGQVAVPKMEVMQAGWMATLVDPTGATFSVWEANQHKGAGTFNYPGAMAWNELWTGDVERSKQFYMDLFGWDAQAQGPVTMFLNNGRPCGSLMQTPADAGDRPSEWLVYWSVGSIDTAMATVEERGGTVMHGPLDIDPGTIAFACDPWGARFALLELKEIPGA